VPHLHETETGRHTDRQTDRQGGKRGRHRERQRGADRDREGRTETERGGQKQRGADRVRRRKAYLSDRIDGFYTPFSFQHFANM
jgi:hypothetical protein